MSHAPSLEADISPGAVPNFEDSTQPEPCSDSIGLTFRANKRTTSYGWLYTDLLGAPTANRSRFKDLIRASTEEITGRYPEYFSHFLVEVQPIGALARDFQSLPAFEKFSTEELALALVRGIQILDDLHVPINLDSTESDAISMILLQSILDAYAATFGSITLKPPPPQTGCFTELLNERYATAETASGVRYTISKRAGRPLLIVSTTGAPLSLWLTLLNDADTPYRCLAVQSRAGSLFEGGTPNRSSFLQDVADIRDVLLANELDQIDVVAWCNGSRTAIELARAEPSRVASLMLVSPTFHGTMDATRYPSPFEDSLISAYSMVDSDPDTGRYLINSLTETGASESSTLSLSPERRVDSVLRMPPNAHADNLFVPLSSLEFFKNYIDRVLSDESYDVPAALQEVQCPILLATGTHDAAVNTQLARDLLSAHGRDVTHATLFGAGHHIHLLQYGYFRHLLDHSTCRSVLVSTARLKVDRLAPAH